MGGGSSKNTTKITPKNDLRNVKELSKSKTKVKPVNQHETGSKASNFISETTKSASRNSNDSTRQEKTMTIVEDLEDILHEPVSIFIIK